MKLTLILLSYSVACMANSEPVIEKNLLECMGTYGKLNILGSSKCYIPELCKEDEDLLFGSTTKINGTYFMRPTCKKRRCPSDQYYWENGNKCVSEVEKEYYCGPYANFRVDPFGATFCECHEDSYRLNDDPHQPCSWIYSPGNCKLGYMIAFENKVPRCIPNECYRREKYTGTRRVFYNGTCYDLDSKEPCNRAWEELGYDNENSPKCLIPGSRGGSSFGSCIGAGDGTCYALSLMRSAGFFRARMTRKRN